MWEMFTQRIRGVTHLYHGFDKWHTFFNVSNWKIKRHTIYFEEIISGIPSLMFHYRVDKLFFLNSRQIWKENLHYFFHIFFSPEISSYQLPKHIKLISI